MKACFQMIPASRCWPLLTLPHVLAFSKTSTSVRTLDANAPFNRFTQNAQSQPDIAPTRPIPPPPTETPAPSGFFRRNNQQSSFTRSGRPPPSPSSRRVVVQPPKTELVHVNLQYEDEFIIEDMTMFGEIKGPGPDDFSEASGIGKKAQAARFRFGRSKAPPRP